MPTAPKPLDPGLYMVSTPIGAARDITLRALDVLAAAEVLAAEDTRALKRLLALHGITPGGRPVLSYHDHSPPAARDRLLAHLAEGRAVAYAAEAGTPMVSDPGYRLVRTAAAAGHPVRPVPGASALLAALAVAGLPSDRFLFAGFLPPRKAARRTAAAELAAVPATLVIYESPGRVRDLLVDLADTLGEDREAAICRELTKRFEEVRRGTLGELARQAGEAPVRGECVVLVARAADAPATAEEMEAALRAALATGSLSGAVAEVAARLGLPRRQVYQAALRIAARDGDTGAARDGDTGTAALDEGNDE